MENDFSDINEYRTANPDVNVMDLSLQFGQRGRDYIDYIFRNGDPLAIDDEDEI